MATENPKRKLTLNQYAEELRGWLHLCQQVQMTNYSSQAYMMGLACQSPQSFTQPISQSANNTANRPDNTAPANNQQQPQTPPRNFPESAGIEVKVPSLVRRVAAEVIDCLILLLVKLFLSYVLIQYGGFNAIQIFDFDYALLSGELDVDKFVSLSSDIMLVEMVHRVFVSSYEAFCLAYVSDIIPPGGFTPGKRMMGLAVIGCDDVFSLGNDRFLVTGMRNPSLKSTMCRSFLKNFSLSVMMPTCLTVFMFDHKRAVYDLLSNTVVIELQPVP